ncbi:MAG: hypothetical protein KGN01_06220, partial [Patescibacteria group bacterium]|nr:hypothetical protein [Patescibacteria group bacterium]
MKIKIASILVVVAVASMIMLGRPKKEKGSSIPSFTISIPYFSRTSRYDYRTVNRGSKQFLEMRQTGKKKWIEVEDVSCKL